MKLFSMSMLLTCAICYSQTYCNQMGVQVENQIMNGCPGGATPQTYTRSENWHFTMTNSTWSTNPRMTFNNCCVTCMDVYVCLAFVDGPAAMDYPVGYSEGSGRWKNNSAWTAGIVCGCSEDSSWSTFTTGQVSRTQCGGACPQSNNCMSVSANEIDYCTWPNSNGCTSYGERNDGWCCVSESPIIIDILGNGFDLTATGQGVLFDFHGTGNPIRLSWTQQHGDDAWLVLDRNGNGAIDNGQELFGNVSPQPPSATRHGFLALAVFDKPENGGNQDARISTADAVFGRLRLWQDRNHNGVSEPSELIPFGSVGIEAVELNYQQSRRVDEHGNTFRYRGRLKLAPGSRAGRFAYDVFLVAGQ